MSRHLTTTAAEIAILQKNLKDLQAKLETAHERILELTKGKNVAKEELEEGVKKPRVTKEKQEIIDKMKKSLLYDFDLTDYKGLWYALIFLLYKVEQH